MVSNERVKISFTFKTKTTISEKLENVICIVYNSHTHTHTVVMKFKLHKITKLYYFYSCFFHISAIIKVINLKLNVTYSTYYMSMIHYLHYLMPQYNSHLISITCSYLSTKIQIKRNMTLM